MPAAGSTVTKNNNGNGKNGGNGAPPMPVIPFARAGREHIEPFVDVTTAALSASAQNFGPFDVPAYGYMTNIVLLVTTASDGSGGSAAMSGNDGPWSLFQQVQLSDVNGSDIFGPVSGYDLYLATKWGGYEYSTDPRQLTSFSAVDATTGAFAFSVKIPVEIVHRDGLGALANQNASSTYKLRFVVGTAAEIYSTEPETTTPTMRIRAFLEAWSQPPNTDLHGQPQATQPPANGTTQYYSKSTATGLNGAQTVRMSRVGNLIRSLIYVCRQASGGTRAQGEANFPDQTSWFYDTRLLHNYQKDVLNDVMVRRTGYTAGVGDAANGKDNGVFVYDFAHDFDGKIGHETGDGYLPTVQSTRLELQGSFSDTNNLDIVTNDVAPAGNIYA